MGEERAYLTVANILNNGVKHKIRIKVVKCLHGMYHININVGNFAVGKLNQWVKFSDCFCIVRSVWQDIYSIYTIYY